MSAPMFAPTEPGMSSAASAAVARRGTPATLNLDDIFGDVMFTPTEHGLLSDLQNEGADVTVLPSGEAQVATLDQDGKPASPWVLHQRQGHGQYGPLSATTTATTPSQYATPEMMNAMKKRKSGASKSGDRKMSEQQKVERRERNREHAKRSHPQEVPSRVSPTVS
ncbi:hypothetical protein MHU86_11880 [Fragilaria crotonensis]|nr:hypothetical protein MHU86_11880 [Fragilaria crotonensis]